jgi:16S rRNA (cytidine1402-2'-O)-methyltransferase
LTSILSIAVIPLEEFAYKGFVPHKKGKETYLKELATSEIPVVFFESVHRVVKTLERLKPFLLADHRLVIGRELTKMHETIYRGEIDRIISNLSSDPIKGEYVLLLLIT